MDQNGVRQMLSQDRNEWRSLTSILDAHPNEPLHATGVPWNSTDVYAHLARWLEISNGFMEHYPDGESVSFSPVEAENMNARWQRKDSRMSLNDARGKAFQAFERRCAIIDSIPLELWDEQLTKVSRYDGADHFALHRSYIQAHVESGGT